MPVARRRPPSFPKTLRIRSSMPSNVTPRGKSCNAASSSSSSRAYGCCAFICSVPRGYLIACLEDKQALTEVSILTTRCCTLQHNYFVEGAGIISDLLIGCHKCVSRYPCLRQDGTKVAPL